jgi:type IV pilus assembly protein PilM
VNRTINFYRTQRGGSAPTRLLLSGGASLMGYLDRFFHESLHLPVEYFNPFRNVELAPTVSRETLSHCAHFFGGVVGAGLRSAIECPIQVSLMPPKIRRERAALRRIPYYAAAGACIFIALLCWSVYFERIARETDYAVGNLRNEVKDVRRRLDECAKLQLRIRDKQAQLTQLTQWIEMRTTWLKILSELHDGISSDPLLWLTDLKAMKPAAPVPGGPPRSGAPPPPAAVPGLPVISELELSGMGKAELEMPSQDIEKVQSFIRRLAPLKESTTPKSEKKPEGQPLAPQKESAARKDSMFLIDPEKQLFQVKRVPTPTDDYDRYAFKFNMTIKLKPIKQ